MKKKIIFTGILLLILFSFFSLGSNSKQEKINHVSIIPILQNNVSYKGEEGVDALTILKQKFSVLQDNSGLVNVIGGRKADSAKHEYWAFYANGKMASVGPADYKTKNADIIEWKIEKY